MREMTRSPRPERRSLRPPTRAVRTAWTAPVLLLALLLAGLPLAAPAAAQEAARQEAPASDENGTAGDGEIFFDSLSVDVINVDVFVTDKEGNPVTDLSKDDFELYEDGREVEISNFYAVDGARDERTALQVANLPVGDAPELEKLPELQAATVPTDQMLHLIVYVDNLFITPFNRNTVMREVDRFLLEHTRPGDKVMLVTFDRSLNVRQPFTEDPRLVSRALEQQLTQRAFGEQAQTERADLISRIEQARSYQAALSHADFYAKSIHHDVEVSLRAMSDLVGSLAGLPGRKAMLLVSEGMPMTAGEDVFAMVDVRFGKASSAQLQANRYRVRRQFRQIVARANSNRVTFYTLDASGGYTHSGISAEHGQIDRSYSEIDFIYDSSRQEPMMVLADGTGGQAAIGTANFAGALEKVAQDLTTYYSLGYSPVHADDGRYHEIEVRVKKKGLKVRHRQGYRSRTLETRLSDGTTAALLYGASVNPLRADIAFGTPEADGKGNYLLPVEVKIPIGEMTLLPTGQVHQARMRVAMAVQDRDGDTSPPSQEAFPVRVANDKVDQAKGDYFTYTAKLMMRSGLHQVAVGVTDEIGGTSSFLRRSVRLGQRQ